MAKTLLERGAVTSLTIANTANGVANSSQAIDTPGTDVGISEHEFRVTLATTAAIADGEAVNLYLASGSEANQFDGGVNPSVSVPLGSLKNLMFLGSLIGDGSPNMITSFAARSSGAKLIIVVENTAALSADGITCTIQPLNLNTA